MNSRTLSYFLLFIICTAVLFSAYFVDRVSLKYFSDWSFNTFFVAMTFAFVALYFLIRIDVVDWTWKQVILLAFLVRIVLLFAEPNLSDDYFRYLWDGHLTLHGINPYLLTPSEFIDQSGANVTDFSKILYSNFNSQNYYSVYPPVSQFLFAVSVWLGGENIGHSIVAMRVLVIAGDMSTVYLLAQLLKQNGQQAKQLLWYAINPLVLIELTVNLHFEVFMICFLLAAIFFLYRQKYFVSGCFWGAAISVKLLPIIFLIFTFKRLSLKNSLVVSCVAVGVFLLSLAPFFEWVIFENISNSLNKYFGYFEFNGGIAYFIRWIGYFFVDYSILYKVMPIIKLCLLVLLVSYSLFEFSQKQVPTLEKAIFITGLIYFLFAGILHPWYITFLIPFGLVASSRVILFWSWLILLSYSAYETSDYLENMWLIGIEFSLLFVLIFAQKLNIKWLSPT